MSEEQEGGLSSLKKTIIGVITTAVTAAGVYLTTNINEFFGVKEEAEVKTEQVTEAPAQGTTSPIIVNIENTNQQKQSGSETKVVERVVEKPAPAKKEETSEEDPW
jgi:CRISPR/Cas system endoribonuclease Cas6 (RAMP superfamily)